MKSWLLAVVLVGCATNVNEEIDASGTVSTTLTWGGGNCANNPYNCADTPNPLPPADTVWIEEMTWMDVRDA